MNISSKTLKWAEGLVSPNFTFLFLSLFVVLISQNTLAQGNSPSFELIDMGDGTHDLRIFLGSSSSPAQNVYELTHSAVCDSFEIDSISQPYFDFSGSWMFDSGSTDTLIEISQQGSHLNLEMKRQDRSPQSGFGEVAVLKGIVIVVDDVNREGRNTMVLAQKDLGIGPNPATDLVEVFVESGVRIYRIQVLTLQGQLVLESTYAQFSVASLPADFYIVRIEHSGGMCHKRLQVIH